MPFNERDITLEYAGQVGTLRGLLAVIIARASHVGFDNPDLMSLALSDIAAMARDGLNRTDHI